MSAHLNDPTYWARERVCAGNFQDFLSAQVAQLFNNVERLPRINLVGNLIQTWSCQGKKFNDVVSRCARTPDCALTDDEKWFVVAHGRFKLLQQMRSLKQWNQPRTPIVEFIQFQVKRLETNVRLARIYFSDWVAKVPGMEGLGMKDSLLVLYHMLQRQVDANIALLRIHGTICEVAAVSALYSVGHRDGILEKMEDDGDGQMEIDYDGRCPVCYEHYGDSVHAMKLKRCGHVYCRTCLMKQFDVSAGRPRTCGLCRVTLLPSRERSLVVLVETAMVRVYRMKRLAKNLWCLAMEAYGPQSELRNEAMKVKEAIEELDQLGMTWGHGSIAAAGARLAVWEAEREAQMDDMGCPVVSIR
ncbi:hypothetical protein BU16DRAFT_534538 [Lophium mytilinum]|uniref:RING-type domain-containing protein n=1 Tax=Lophium mytilinum TaxID=390894 RepID=A0A6A6RDV4_9PEZI|nr:hypothetical protein BU16DRAFT_534538 [Lophium mytilinum]